jgi:hypothetical protein
MIVFKVNQKKILSQKVLSNSLNLFLKQKICYGKQTLAMVRKDAKLPPIPATPNFSTHMSVIAPREKDDIEAQFDHSQVNSRRYKLTHQPKKKLYNMFCFYNTDFLI